MKINPATETVQNCVVCGAADTIADTRFSALLGLAKPYGVARCIRCGLRWLSPRPTPAGYRDLYTAQNYFDGEHAVESYSAIRPVRAAYFWSRIARIERYFAPASLSILDIGAATGEFVNVARTRGHNAVGIELSDSARQSAQAAYGLTLLDTDLQSMEGSELYDVIHMNHVFEHLPDPIAALQACRSLLRPEGLLVLEVPQQLDNDLDRLKRLLRISKSPEFNAYSLHHTYFYTPRTLARLLTQNGWRIRCLRTASPGRTPMRLFGMLNLMLRMYLWVSDKVHRGGNIIEVYACKP